MKKLLLLGGSRYLLPVIKAAKTLGLYTITCDYLPDNIAHKYSDEYVNVSIIDKNAVLEKAKELQIDGIMSFATDPGVVTAAFVAEAIGLPSCGPYDSVCILQNKGRFRKFLTDNGFNAPFSKSYRSIGEALSDSSLFHWPVIVKPTDSAGSKGVTKVVDPNNLEKSIKHALGFSLSKEFIIEEFIVKKGYSSDSDCFSVDGVLRFVSFSSQRFDSNANNPFTPAAFSWPSTIDAQLQTELTNELQRLLTLLGMGTSLYNIETCEGIDGKAYIMEVSPRGGGNRLAEMLKFATGVDLITNSIRGAVGLPIEEMEQKPYNGFWAEVILHSNKSGIFKELSISTPIEQNVVQTDLWIVPGTTIKSFSGANDSIGTVVLRFDTEEALLEGMNRIDERIKVLLY